MLIELRRGNAWGERGRAEIPQGGRVRREMSTRLAALRKDELGGASHPRAHEPIEAVYREYIAVEMYRGSFKRRISSSEGSYPEEMSVRAPNVWHPRPQAVGE